MNIKDKRIIYIILAALICTMLFAGCGKDDKYVQTVKTGHMDMASGVAIGKAFDKFFKNGEWKSFISTDKQRIVEFNGDFSWKNKPAKLTVQFTIHPNNTFEMNAMSVNGVDMNDYDSTSIMHKILLGN